MYVDVITNLSLRLCPSPIITRNASIKYMKNNQNIVKQKLKCI